MSEQQKAPAQPYARSGLRWLMTVIVGMCLGLLLTLLAALLLYLLYPDFMSYMNTTPFFFMEEQLVLVGSFVPLFLGMVLAIRLVAKMPMRVFIHGEGEKLSKKTCLVILGLYLLGNVAACLLCLPNIRHSGVAIDQFLIYAVVMLLLIWMQTSTEEFVFRGVFLRWACGTDIRMSGKAVTAGVISSLLFMALHFSNPEMLAQSGVQIVFAALAYFTIGMGAYVANLYFKSLMPGLLIHWLNNMVAFLFVSNEVSVGNPLSLFVDMGEATGIYVLSSVLVSFLPLAIWMAVKAKREKKA